MAKMHADEVDIDAALVGDLLADQHPDLAGHPVREEPSTGTSNALFRLGADLVVRMPRLERAVQQIEKDMAWLPRLAPLLPRTIPAPQRRGAPGRGYPFPWGVYRWIDGDIAAVDGLRRPDAVARALAGFVAALHAVTLDAGPAARRGAPLATQDDGVREAIAALAGTYDERVLTALWDEALAVPPWTGAPVWVHGDLAPSNLLVADDDLGAVIDFGGLGVGDPACDMIPAWNLLPVAQRATYREVVGVDDATWERGRGWALSISLLQLPYYWDTNPALADNSRHVIDAVIAEAVSDR